MIDTDEMVDLSDLNLLDDASRHCRCTYCNPGPVGALDPFTAICGRRVVIRDDRRGNPLAVSTGRLRRLCGAVAPALCEVRTMRLAVWLVDLIAKWIDDALDVAFGGDDDE